MAFRDFGTAIPAGDAAMAEKVPPKKAFPVQRLWGSRETFGRAEGGVRRPTPNKRTAHGVCLLHRSTRRDNATRGY
jgi:hypothetical protein